MSKREGLIPLRSTLSLTSYSGDSMNVSGLYRADAARIADRIDEHRTRVMRAAAAETSKRLQEIAADARRLFESDRWLRFSEVEAFRPLLEEAQDVAARSLDWMGESERQIAKELANLLADLEPERAKHNAEYREREAPLASDAVRAAFNGSVRPTDEQAHAVVTSEDCTLLLAGAGTGKTTAIVSKVVHLVNRRSVPPEAILVLAFNRSAAEEVKQRLEALGPVRVSTFHAFGRSLIAEAEDAAPSLAPFAEDEAALRQLLRTYVEEALRDERTRDVFAGFFLNHMIPYKSAFDFPSQGAYYEYVRTCEPRALDGTKVKSFEELGIANFLAMNGVAFRYEEAYEEATATAKYRQYRPDFFLPDYGIYIEHYGVDRVGRTAPGVDRERYQESMAWKRELHRQHGTTCIETFSYQRQEGTLVENLEEQLRAHGVAFRPIDADSLLTLLRGLGAVDRLGELLATFLSHYKSNGLQPDEVRNRASQLPDAPRLRAFIEVFLSVFDRYEAELARTRLVDFHDFIARAASLIRSGAVSLPFHHVLVDEFQDISAGRAKLLEAIVHTTSAELFAVGDDWQAIYRFAGSDISVLRQCDRRFGKTEQLLLTRTFRFDDNLQAVSTRFVTANPAQIARALEPNAVTGAPAAFIVMASDTRAAIVETLSKIEAQNHGAHVLVLGRYQNSRQQVPPTRGYNLKVQFSTVHAAKGTEADFVIIVDLKEAKFGFPSQVADDPILALVLPDDEPFPHAEERRLFYVAMTRARKAAYLIADTAQPSDFIKELDDGAYAVEWQGRGVLRAARCPECETGRMRRSQSGARFVCSNAPLCTFLAIPCPACQSGSLLPAPQAVQCSNSACGHHERLCPRCRRGQVVRRESQYGPFNGCSAFGGDPPCYFTERL